MRLRAAALAGLVAGCASAPALTAAPELVAHLSSELSEWNATATADGRTTVFARSPEADFENARVWIANRIGGRWSVAAAPFSTGPSTDSDPQISADGREILFVSNRASPGVDAPPNLDLWRVSRIGAGWGEPRPLPVVNSRGPELGPELHAGVLYFNTARRSGLGGLDIWSARVSGDGFDAPAPLPAPLNSASSEGDFTLSPDGRVAVFWSDRPGGAGEGDLYVSRRLPDGWTQPVNLGPVVNSAAFDFTPSFSADGLWLTFASMRPRDGADRKSDIYRIRVAAVPALAEALALR